MVRVVEVIDTLNAMTKRTRISPLKIFFTVKRPSTSGMVDDAFTSDCNAGMLKIGTTAPATAGNNFKSGKKSKSV